MAGTTGPSPGRAGPFVTRTRHGPSPVPPGRLRSRAAPVRADAPFKAGLAHLPEILRWLPFRPWEEVLTDSIPSRVHIPAGDESARASEDPRVLAPGGGLKAATGTARALSAPPPLAPSAAKPPLGTLATPEPTPDVLATSEPSSTTSRQPLRLGECATRLTDPDELGHLCALADLSDWAYDVGTLKARPGWPALGLTLVATSEEHLSRATGGGSTSPPSSPSRPSRLGVGLAAAAFAAGLASRRLSSLLAYRDITKGAGRDERLATREALRGDEGKRAGRRRPRLERRARPRGPGTPDDPRPLARAMGTARRLARQAACLWARRGKEVRPVGLLPERASTSSDLVEVPRAESRAGGAEGATSTGPSTEGQEAEDHACADGAWTDKPRPAEPSPLVPDLTDPAAASHRRFLWDRLPAIGFSPPARPRPLPLPPSPTSWLAADDRNGTRLFVIKGSDSLDHWRLNAACAPEPFERAALRASVHAGVYAAARALAPRVAPLVRAHLAASPRNSVSFAGHSLGGGIAQAVALLLVSRGDLPPGAVRRVVGFGAPATFCERTVAGLVGAGTGATGGGERTPTPDDAAGRVPTPRQAGDALLARLGLRRETFASIALPGDVVPRLLAADAGKLGAVAQAIAPALRSHAGMTGKRRFVYHPLGVQVLLQVGKAPGPTSEGDDGVPARLPGGAPPPTSQRGTGRPAAPSSTPFTRPDLPDASPILPAVPGAYAVDATPGGDSAILRWTDEPNPFAVLLSRASLDGEILKSHHPANYAASMRRALDVVLRE